MSEDPSIELEPEVPELPPVTKTGMSMLICCNNNGWMSLKVVRLCVGVLLEVCVIICSICSLCSHTVSSGPIKGVGTLCVHAIKLYYTYAYMTILPYRHPRV